MVRTAFGCVPACLCAAALFFLIPLGTTVTSADDRPENELKLKTEKVIVFKDGYCLIAKRGTAVANEQGEIFTHEVPDAAMLGSFWATPQEGRLVSMTAGWTETTNETEKEVSCTQTIEVLQANVGKQCSIQLNDNAVLSGKIARVLTQETTSALSDSQRLALGLQVTALRPQLSAAPALVPSQVIDGIAGSHFVVKTDDGEMLVPVSDVRRMTVKDMKTTLLRTVTTKAKSKRLTFRLADPNKPYELLLTYFRPGVRWIPTYRINLTTNEQQEKIAEISMQAEILNEAEDLLDMPMDIVVGVPNFRFRENVSPLVLESTLRNALVQAAPNLMGQFRNDFSNSSYMQRSSEFRRDAAQASGAGDGGAGELPGELTATGAQDLFVYNLPKLSLKQGERAAVPILTAAVPYRNVYTWDLQVTRNDIGTAPSGSGIQSPLVLSENRVWRQIELTNNTKLPWTTGAAMIMQGRQPLAQELLTYTSPKDQCRVPVTVAVDVRGSFEESEVGRELQALNWSGYHYAKIQQQAKLDVCNNKSEAIDLEVSFRFGGKADKVSHEGKITLAPYRAEDWQNYRGRPAVNNSSVVKWKAALDPGETFLPTVDYHFYTRQ